MGSSSSTQRDVRGAGRMAFDAALQAGTKVPVVGGFVDLLNDAKAKFEELHDRVDEAEDVVVWIQNIVALFEPLEDRLRTANDETPIDSNLRTIVIRAKDALLELVDVAQHISNGSKPRKFLRSAIFANDFKAAKDKMEQARQIFDTSLAVDTNVHVHAISEDQKKLIAGNKTLIEMVQLAVRGNPQIDDRVKSAVESLAKGNAVETTRILNEAPADVVESALALLARGAALITGVKYAEAVAVLQEAVQKDPSLASAWYALGLARERMGQYAGAADACERAIDLLDREGKQETIEYANALDWLGVVLWRQGKYDDAEIHLRRALRLVEELLGDNDPATAVGLNNLGLVLKAQVRVPIPLMTSHPRGSTTKRSPSTNAPLPSVKTFSAPTIRTLRNGSTTLARSSDSRYGLVLRLVTLNRANTTKRSGTTTAPSPLVKMLWEKPIPASGRPCITLHRCFMTRFVLFDVVREFIRRPQGEYSEARSLTERSLKIHEINLGPDHPQTKLVISGLAHIEARLGHVRNHDTVLPLQ